MIGWSIKQFHLGRTLADRAVLLQSQPGPVDCCHVTLDNILPHRARSEEIQLSRGSVQAEWSEADTDIGIIGETVMGWLLFIHKLHEVMNVRVTEG